MGTYSYLNDGIVSLVEKRLGEDADTVLKEMDSIISLESVLPPMLDKGRTYGDWNLPALNLYYAGDYRPTEALPIDVIVQMLKSAPVRFALEMKRASVMSVFRNERSWQIHSPDEELIEVVTANLSHILPKMALDFSFSSLAYGASFQELIWEYKTKYELGIGDDTGKGGSKFVVAKIPNSVNPATVVKINRNKEGHFEGFVQQPKTFQANEIVVPKEAALVIPYEEKFRNLWGESLLKPMYPIWFWYEVVLRSMVKYMERTGTPVAVVKAPSRATIIKPGTRTKVDGITWGMEIASNVSRSNAAVIPSDTDEQGKPLWDLSYLNSTERSQPFLDILELLTQMILRAGLSADRALTQSSGGVGSYAIGQVHQEATALHNELILIQWIHYLNTYFLPLYSLYNRGQGGPPIWIETQGLDPLDRDNLTALLGVAQGMEAFKEVGYRIDWESLLSVNNIPLISQEEADATKKKQEEDNLKKQEDMLATQAKFNTPSPTKQSDGSLKANLPDRPAQDKKLDATSNFEIIKLDVGFNPYRDKVGRFASGPGGGNAGIMAHAALRTEAVGQAQTNGGSFVKTTGKILGIGGLGVVGLVSLKAMLAGGGNQMDEYKQDRLAMLQSKVKELTEGWPKTTSNEESLRIGVDMLKSLGVTEIPDDIKIQEGNPAERTGIANALGYYDPGTNTFVMSNDMAKDLQEGVPIAWHVLLHELAHSQQEHAGQDPNWGNANEMSPDSDPQNFFPSLEGQNDLVTLRAMSKLYGRPLDNYEISNISNDYYDSATAMRELESGVFSTGARQRYGAVGYPEEAKYWAGLSYAGARKSGIKAQEFLTNSHKTGFSANEQHQILVDIFPAQMSSGGYYVVTESGAKRKFPSISDVNQWIASEGIDTDQAYYELLQAAVNE